MAVLPLVRVGVLGDSVVRKVPASARERASGRRRALAWQRGRHAQQRARATSDPSSAAQTWAAVAAVVVVVVVVEVVVVVVEVVVVVVVVVVAAVVVVVVVVVVALVGPACTLASSPPCSWHANS